MPTRPCTDLRLLRKTAENQHSAVAVTLMADAAQTLARRLAVPAGTYARQAIAERLHQLGIAEVYFDNSLQESQTRLEAEELLRRLRQGGPLPFMLSSCPGWVERLCTQSPEQEQFFCLSQTHLRCRGLALRSLLTAQRRIPFSRIAHVTVVSCAAQKTFYGRSQSSPHSCIGEEYVITVRELCLWLCMTGALPHSEVPQEEPPVPPRSRLSQVCRQACQLDTGTALPDRELPLTPAAGNSCIHEGCMELAGHKLRYARVRGQQDALRLLALAQQGQSPYDLIEVFLCGACC